MEAKQALEDCISAQDFSHAAELKERISKLESQRVQLAAEAAQPDKEKEVRVEKVQVCILLLPPSQSLTCAPFNMYCWDICISRGGGGIRIKSIFISTIRPVKTLIVAPECFCLCLGGVKLC